MARRIALFGGSFNPPGKSHREIAARLSREFDEVIVVPCGPRPDKPVTNDVEPIYRAAMVDMNFRGLDRVRAELFDLEASTFTHTADLEARFRDEGEVWHVVGTDLILGGAQNESIIHRQWDQGAELWNNARFAVVGRSGYRLSEEDLPPNHHLFEASKGSSAEIRSQIFHRQSVDGVLLPAVAAFIQRYGLYRGVAPNRQVAFRLRDPRFLIVSDELNPRALSIATTLTRYESNDPELIVVIGGDGTMLRAIRQHWRRRVPFYGINTGHLGFLLNEKSPLEHVGTNLVLAHVPLLYCETEAATGEKQTALAFNDAWVERATGHTAWIRVRVNGEERLSELVADGALVATAAGSTAYARAMGATALPLTTPALLLVGSNVLKPAFWRPVVLPLDSSVELTTLDLAKRPLECYIDGVSQGIVSALRARLSNTAAVELVFAPPHDPAAKLASIQFPKPDQG